ncbi:MAG: hypothetical protein LBJ17_05405 [Dysgonamonadaceae bacterium]|jgi:hypothetical protein|nr:hypothetical protein [Dysgonamonadaceae bacterium]
MLKIYRSTKAKYGQSVYNIGKDESQFVSFNRVNTNAAVDSPSIYSTSAEKIQELIEDSVYFKKGEIVLEKTVGEVSDKKTGKKSDKDQVI